MQRLCVFSQIAPSTNIFHILSHVERNCSLIETSIGLGCQMKAMQPNRSSAPRHGKIISSAASSSVLPLSCVCSTHRVLLRWRATRTCGSTRVFACVCIIFSKRLHSVIVRSCFTWASPTRSTSGLKAHTACLVFYVSSTHYRRGEPNVTMIQCISL